MLRVAAKMDVTVKSLPQELQEKLSSCLKEGEKHAKSGDKDEKRDKEKKDDKEKSKGKEKKEKEKDKKEKDKRDKDKKDKSASKGDSAKSNKKASLPQSTAVQTAFFTLVWHV